MYNFETNNFKHWLTSLFSSQSSNTPWKANERSFCIQLYFSSNSFKFVQQMLKNEFQRRDVPSNSRIFYLDEEHLIVFKSFQSELEVTRAWNALKTSPGASKCAFSGATLIWSMFWNDVITTYWIRFSMFCLYKPKCQRLKLMLITKKNVFELFFRAVWPLTWVPFFWPTRYKSERAGGQAPCLGGRRIKLERVPKLYRPWLLPDFC